MIIDKDNISLSLHWLKFFVLKVRKDGILTAILAIVGIGLLPNTNNYNFFALKTNNSSYCQMLK